MAQDSRDISQSVLSRLRNKAVALGLPRDNMLRLYCQEALLARVAHSRYRDKLILKGGLNLYARYLSAARPTQDIDLAARHLPNTEAEFKVVLANILSLEWPDQVNFDEEFQTQPIAEDATYPGVRAYVTARLGVSESMLQLDVSFGNPITPEPEALKYPVLLGQQPYLVLGYPLPTIVAEKYAVAVELGAINTRIKDFYDLYHIATHEVLGAADLRQAILRTFAGRGITIPQTTLGWVLTPNFAADRAMNLLWQNFLRRSTLEAPGSFPEVVARISQMVAIPDDAARWNFSGGGWSNIP